MTLSSRRKAAFQASVVADPELSFIRHMSQSDLDSPSRKPDSRAALGTEGWLRLRSEALHKSWPWWPAHHHTIISHALHWLRGRSLHF